MCVFIAQALSQALLQVRADLVDTAQRTLEGETAREMQEANIKELVEKRTQQLMVCLIVQVHVQIKIPSLIRTLSKLKGTPC